MKIRRVVFVLAVLVNVFVTTYGFFLAVLLWREDEEGTMWWVIVPVASALAIVSLLWPSLAQCCWGAAPSQKSH